MERPSRLRMVMMAPRESGAPKNTARVAILRRHFHTRNARFPHRSKGRTDEVSAARKGANGRCREYWRRGAGYGDVAWPAAVTVTPQTPSQPGPWSIWS